MAEILHLNFRYLNIALNNVQTEKYFSCGLSQPQRVPKHCEHSYGHTKWLQFHHVLISTSFMVYFTSSYHNFTVLFILLSTLLSHYSCLVAQTSQSPENKHPPTALLCKVKIIVGTCKVNRNVW